MGKVEPDQPALRPSRAGSAGIVSPNNSAGAAQALARGERGVCLGLSKTAAAALVVRNKSKTRGSLGNASGRPADQSGDLSLRLPVDLNPVPQLVVVESAERILGLVESILQLKSRTTSWAESVKVQIGNIPARKGNRKERRSEASRL